MKRVALTAAVALMVVAAALGGALVGYQLHDQKTQTVIIKKEEEAGQYSEGEGIGGGIGGEPLP